MFCKCILFTLLSIPLNVSCVSFRLCTMALRGAVTRLLSNAKKCAAISASRAQDTAAASPAQNGEFTCEHIIT